MEEYEHFKEILALAKTEAIMDAADIEEVQCVVGDTLEQFHSRNLVEKQAANEVYSRLLRLRQIG